MNLNDIDKSLADAANLRAIQNADDRSAVELLLFLMGLPQTAVGGLWGRWEVAEAIQKQSQSAKRLNIPQYQSLIVFATWFQRVYNSGNPTNMYREANTVRNEISGVMNNPNYYMFEKPADEMSSKSKLNSLVGAALTYSRNHP